jgi:transcription elongation factor GreA
MRRLIDETHLDVSKVLVLSNVKSRTIQRNGAKNRLVAESEADLKTENISYFSYWKRIVGKKSRRYSRNYSAKWCAAI